MNTMKIEFTSKLQNEVFIRTAVVAFLMPYQPNVDEIMEIKTILAEAVVNSMIHAYQEEGIINLTVSVSKDKLVTLIIEDYGKGIEDIELARQPMYTTRVDLERSGMGLTIMETFSDSFSIESELNRGTKIICTKKIGNYE